MVDVDLDDSDFTSIGEYLEEGAAPVLCGRVGSTTARLIPLDSAVDAAAQWMTLHRPAPRTDLRSDVPAGFLDQRIEVGADWEATLMRELARCQVLVPIYSPRFVGSDWCGREWQAFERRQQAQRERRTFTRNAIVPVMWTPVTDLELPAVCQEVQYFGGSAGQTYRSEGVYALTTGRRLAYERTTLAIAREIIAVARSSRLEPCEVELFDDLGNAFEEKP